MEIKSLNSFKKTNFSSSALKNDVIQGALLEKGATRRAVLEGHYSRFNAPGPFSNSIFIISANRTE